VLARLLPAGAPVALVLGAAPGLTGRAYQWVADHRTAVSRPVPKAWKARARERVTNR